MENIFTTSQPFLKLAAVIGVFPMTFHGPSRKGELKTKWWNVVISITVFTTLVIFIFLQTMTSTTSKLPSKISSNAWYTLFNLEFIGHLILYIGQCYRRNHVLEFLKLIQSFDDRYIQLSCVEFNYRRQRMLVTSTTWFIVITAISMSALGPLYWLCKNKPELINYGISATFLLSNLLKMFYVSQFSFACTAITLRFEFMKKCIETPTKNAFIMQRKLANICQMYHKLCDCIQMLNTHLTFQMIILLTQFLFFIIFLSFGIVLEFYMDRILPSVLFIYHASALAMFLLCVMIICNAGHRTTKQAQEISETVSKFITAQNLNGTHNLDFIFFMAALNSRNVNLENFLFKINWNVFLSIVSTTITYLIITCQFEKM